jgi:peptide/nickel transport system permease protein
MVDYATRRVLLVVPTLLLASLLVFAVMRVLPGDVTGAILGGEGEALRPEVVEALRSELGLDAPLPLQYVRWIGSLAAGDGGRSLVTRESVADLIARQLPVTLLLALYAFALALLVAVPLGALAAQRAGSGLDLAVRGLAVAGAALPGFWLALLALLAVVTLLRWSPPLAYLPPTVRPLEHLEIMAIPALVLAFELGAHLLRTTRAGTLEALGQDHVRTAVAKGVSPLGVTLRHALRTASLGVVTVAGAQVGTLVGGAVVLEAVFGLPGLGRGLVTAVVTRDYPVVQGLALVLVAVVLAVNLVVDLLYALLDPRIRYA